MFWSVFEKIALVAAALIPMIALYKWLTSQAAKKSFTKHEKDLLVAALDDDDRHIHVVPIERVPHVHINRQTFDNNLGPGERSRYHEAFESLCRRGLMKPVDPPELFALSSDGMEAATKLRAKAV